MTEMTLWFLKVDSRVVTCTRPLEWANTSTIYTWGLIQVLKSILSGITSKFLIQERTRRINLVLITSSTKIAYTNRGCALSCIHLGILTEEIQDGRGVATTLSTSKTIWQNSLRVDSSTLFRLSSNLIMMMMKFILLKTFRILFLTWAILLNPWSKSQTWNPT